jgi:glycosyltransferase involved in cell wall biosynthesis
MKIAQISPLYESVPPEKYGGTERVVSYLTEELIRQGHEVTLFASGDSITDAELVACCPRSLRVDPACIDPLVHHYLMLEEVFNRASQFDLIHFHIDYLHFPLSRRSEISQLTTLHGRLDLPDLAPLYRQFREMPLVSISYAQRRPIPSAGWLATVHHGLPEHLFRFHETPGDYLAFLGRISPEKRVDRAIEIAKRVGMPLKIAAKVDKVDQDYFATVIKPLLDPALVEFIGEVGGKDKEEFLGSAYALLFPIDWPEPFGLVMIESMACGTPVIAWPHGSVPEVMENGVAGFIVENVEEATRAVEKLAGFDRRNCREVFERRFTASRMAKDYVSIYQQVLKKNSDIRVNVAKSFLNQSPDVRTHSIKPRIDIN